MAANNTTHPSQAQGAQIPLQSFNLPGFPAEARTLKALTLTSEIKVDEYQSILSQPFSVPPSIPHGIESLTLELFSLGYPPGFLQQLAERLPNLKSVVIYSQLFPGTTKESQEDAIEFFKRLPNLRALHLLDVFAKPGFFEKAAEWLTYNTSDTPGEARRGLMFLEVNYTFRHDDDEFMSKIPATELHALIGPGLISCSLNISPPDDEDVADHERNSSSLQSTGNKEGVMAFTKPLASKMLAGLTDEHTYPRGLRALNTTLFTLTPEQFQTVADRNKHIMVLNVTLEVDPGDASKKKIVAAIEQCPQLEQIEIVINPSVQLFMELADPHSQALKKTFPSSKEMESLSLRCTKLTSFKVNILRTNSFGFVEWQKKDGKWIGGVHGSVGT